MVATSTEGIGKENHMTRGQRLIIVGATMAFAGVAMVGMLMSSPRGRADDRGDNSDSRIEQGFDIAPVPLNLEGKNRALVGLGSYIVNAQGDCNGCHSAGPATEFLPGGNPYFGQKPTKINPATYLGGGRDFGMISGPPSPHIISRNLTPSTKSGLPESDYMHPRKLSRSRRTRSKHSTRPRRPLQQVSRSL